MLRASNIFSIFLKHITKTKNQLNVEPNYKSDDNNTSLRFVLIVGLASLFLFSLVYFNYFQEKTSNAYGQAVQGGQFLFKFNAVGEGLAINNTGFVYHADAGGNTVKVYTSQGVQRFSFSAGSTPVRLDIDSVGNVFVAERDSNRIEKFTPNGNSLLTFSVTQPFGIALDSSNRVYVTSFTTHRVYVFDSNGNFLFNFGALGSSDGQFNEPIGIDVDSLGRIYVADNLNNRIQVFDSNGNFLFKFGSFGSGDGQLINPKDVVVDNNGKLYVADGANNRIQVFHSNGNFLFKFGSLGSGNGQFISLSSIAVNNTGHIYADDTVPNPPDQRVQVFSPVVSTLSENQVLGQVTILGTCGLAFASGAPINYGSLTPNAISTEKILAFDNTGNVNGTVKVRGGDWKDVSSIARMYVNATKISNSTSTYAAKSILKFTDQSFGIVTSAVNKTTFWQLQVKLISSNFTGSLTQTMNFTVTC